MSVSGVQDFTNNGVLNVVGGNQTNINNITVLQVAGSSGASSGFVHDDTGRILTSVVAVPSTPAAQRISVQRSSPRLSPMFTGRRDILDQLSCWFDPSNPSIALKLQRIFVLYGLGGAGKTQIMAKFVNDHGNQFSRVYHIDGGTVATIKANLEDIAQYTSAGETVDDALRWFAQQRDEWLLVVDNADDPEINLGQFLPPCTHGNIIITSRNPDCRQYAPVSNCNISGMKPDDAIELLLKSSMAEHSAKNRQICGSICEELGYLALAIAQAGAYIARSCSLSDYLDLYHEDRHQLLQKQRVQRADSYEWTVYTTWEMSWKKLPPTAARLLQLCAFMHHDGISRTIFQSAGSSDDSEESLQDAHRFLNNFRQENGKWSNLKFLDTVKELTSYSLINIDSEAHVYSIHPLVHAWARQRSNLLECNETQSCMLQILALSVPSGNDADAFTLRRTLIPHIDESRSSTMQPGIAERLANVYYDCRRWQEAEELQMLAVEAKQKLHGDEDLDTTSSMGKLASTYRHNGRLKEAEELELHVMTTRKKLLGSEHPDTILAVANLATTHRKQGRWREAESLELQVLAARKRLLGNGHPDTILAMANLATTYRKQGKWSEAEELDLQVLAARKRIFGDEHPETLLAVGNLASTYWNQRRWEEAKKLGLQVMTARKRLLGDDHPDTILAKANLASTYRKQGHCAEAEKLTLQVLEARKRLLGDEHPDTLVAMSNLASTYRQQGKWEAAEQLSEQVVVSREKLFGDEHPDTIRAMSNLAFTFRGRGRWKQAEELYRRVLATRRRLLGDEHLDTIFAVNNLADTYRMQRKWRDAEEIESLAREAQIRLLARSSSTSPRQ